MPLLIILFSCVFLSSCSYFYAEKQPPAKAVPASAGETKAQTPASHKKPVADKRPKATAPTKPQEKTVLKPAQATSANTQKTASKTPAAPKPVTSKPDEKPIAATTPPETSVSKKPVVKPPALKPGKLSGVLQVLNGQKHMPPENALITLTSLKLPAKAVNPKPQTKLVNMTNKAYQPQFVLLTPGDTLAFKNNDAIKHNVFSSSKNNSFDLGTYGYNRIVEQQIQNEGVVKVYCNIHPEMALFVAVKQTPFKAITDANGKFSITNIPPGRYRLNIWHLRGEQNFNVQISSGGHVQKTFTLNTESFTPKKHLNKFGKPYKKKPVLFQDEFY